jgi:hypothetical protein
VKMTDRVEPQQRQQNSRGLRSYRGARQSRTVVRGMPSRRAISQSLLPVAIRARAAS